MCVAGAESIHRVSEWKLNGLIQSSFSADNGRFPRLSMSFLSAFDGPSTIQPFPTVSDNGAIYDMRTERCLQPNFDDTCNRVAQNPCEKVCGRRQVMMTKGLFRSIKRRVIGILKTKKIVGPCTLTIVLNGSAWPEACTFINARRLGLPVQGPLAADRALAHAAPSQRPTVTASHARPGRGQRHCPQGGPPAPRYRRRRIAY